MAATLATIEAYLTAAQTAFSDSDYTETKKQIILGQMELAKLPASEADGGSSLNLREGFDKLLTAVKDFQKVANRGTRRSQLGEV